MTNAKEKALDYYLKWIDKEGTYVGEMLDIAIQEAKREVFKDIENLSRPLAGDFGDTPIYRDYIALKKKHLGRKESRRE